MQLRVILVFMLLSIASLACNLSESEENTPVPEANLTGRGPQPTITAVPNDLPVMQTYQDEVHGYSIDYPENWTRTGGGNMALTIFSYDPNNVSGREQGVPEGELKVDVIANSHQDGTTLDTLIEQYASDSTILSRLDITLNDGTPAVILRTKSDTFGTEGNLFVVIVGDLDIVASGLGDSDLFTAIVRSIH